MILVGLKLRIKDFWACIISEKFGETQFQILDIHPSKDYSQGLLTVSAETHLKEVKDYLLLLKDIKKAEILLDEPDTKLLSFYFKHGPLGDIILQTGVHIRPPLELENGIIKVNLIGLKENVNKFIKLTDELENITMEIDRKSGLKFLNKPLLTRQQERILKEAVKLGYYDLPRRITTMKLSEKLGLSASTVTEHLRKAEKKILIDYI
jgi:predicted DNA binding protein